MRRFWVRSHQSSAQVSLQAHRQRTYILKAFPMSESSLPLIDSKLQTEASTSRPQRSPVEAFVAANARKLAVLLALFLTGCLGLGAKHWIDNKETNLDISKVVSSHQGAFDFAADVRPDIPDIIVNFHHDYHFEATQLHISEISPEMHAAAAQAEVITAATLTWRQWHLNYYHGLGESVFEVHSLACKWLGYCGAANSTDLAPIFIERPGDQASWAQFLPAAESALKCLFPGPNHFIGDDRIRDKMFLLKTSAAGIGPYNRKWRGFFDQGEEFKHVYAAVDKSVSVAYRERLIKCYGLEYEDFNPEGPYKVTIVNRQYHKGRHMVNSLEIAQKIEEMPEVQSTRIVYMEPLPFKEQIKVYASSQVLLMTHGAALVNIMFMPKDSVVVLYNWLKRDTLSPHTWVTDYMNDLALPVNFVGLSTEDRRFIYPQKERYVFQPEYARLNAEERATLLETGICPPGGLPGCDDMVMNFAVDWNLLHGALRIAFGDMHQKHSHILDGTG
ncbi:MAG: hypothetical protein FRX49_10395 [Trebouxia sp. A1-2]|nr:MAG: hypothetical protein FRX49_10395 [Trebouxia sp. A1-2]